MFENDVDIENIYRIIQLFGIDKTEVFVCKCFSNGYGETSGFCNMLEFGVDFDSGGDNMMKNYCTHGEKLLMV